MELNFACQKLTIEQVLKCTFGLNKTEVKLLKVLRCGNELSIKDLEKRMQKDRSTIQRAVKALADKELIIRKQYNLDTGGYVFVYKCMNKELLKKRMKNSLDKFYSNLELAIDKF